MHLYLTAWRSLAAVLAALGALTACVAVPPSLLSPLLVYLVLLGLLLPTVRRRRRALLGLPPLALDAPLRRALRSAVLCALSGLAVLGLFVSIGVATNALMALLVAGSPPALERYRRYRRRWPALTGGNPERPITAHGGSGTLGSTVPGFSSEASRRRMQAMTVEQLCRAWRDSYTALQGCRDAGGRVRLLDARQQYLDEMERRDPAAFELWLSTGARAAGDPSKYRTAALRGAG